MKHFKVVVILLVVLAFIAMPVPAAKAAGPSGSWGSGIACQNLSSTTDANVALDFYPEMNGTSVISYSAVIPAGGSKNWLTTQASSMPGFPTGFLGSGILSSDVDVSCNVNTQSAGTGTTANPYRIGTNGSMNSSQVGAVMFIPQAIKNLSGWNSYFAVQNTAAATVTVNIAYFNAAGAEISAAAQSAAIPANSAKIFYQNDNANLPAGFNGGVRVSSADGSTKLAVTVALYRDATDYTRSQFLSYNGQSTGYSKIFVPRFVRSLVGYNSGMAIQNVGDTPTIATVVFRFNGVNYNYVTPSIAPNTSHLIYAPSAAVLAPVDALPSNDQHQGSAIVTVDDTANDRVVVTVNEDNQSGAPTRLGQGTTYNAPGDTTQTNTLFFAQFTKWAASIFNSGVQVSNTTGSAGTCDIVYVAAPSANETGVVLPANGSIIRYAPSIVALPNGYNAAVKVTCTQPVTGIVNLSALNKYGDSFTQTTGLNQ